jgi:KDO2-lipid IV(A) lauroyltransferase
MQAAGLRGMHALVISIAQPGGGYRLQNNLRRERGLEMTPASMSALKQAVDRLRSGRSVLTGVDRPVPEASYRPRFFGRPAALPLHHIYLALKTGAPVYVFAARQYSDGLYHLGAVGPIEVRPMEDHHAAMLYNGEKVLEAAEGLICQAPQQWSMFYPVWPEALAEVP